MVCVEQTGSQEMFNALLLKRPSSVCCESVLGKILSFVSVDVLVKSVVSFSIEQRWETDV